MFPPRDHDEIRAQVRTSRARVVAAMVASLVALALIGTASSRSARDQMRIRWYAARLDSAEQSERLLAIRALAEIGRPGIDRVFPRLVVRAILDAPLPSSINAASYFRLNACDANLEHAGGSVFVVTNVPNAGLRLAAPADQGDPVRRLLTSPRPSRAVIVARLGGVDPPDTLVVLAADDEIVERVLTELRAEKLLK